MHGPVRKYNASRLGTFLLLELLFKYLSARNTNSYDQTYQVTVSGILDGHDTDSVELTSGSTEVDIGTVVMVDIGLGAKQRYKNAVRLRRQRLLTAWRNTRSQTCGGEGSFWRSR